MFPGLASSPKNWGCDASAPPRRTRSAVRPSSPTIGFEAVTCIASATLSMVMRASPWASFCYRMRSAGHCDISRAWTEKERNSVPSTRQGCS